MATTDRYRPGDAAPFDSAGLLLPDEDLLAIFPDGAIDFESRAYYSGIAQRRLIINRCTKCGLAHHPPRPMCPACWSRSMGTMEVTGGAVIVSLVLSYQGMNLRDWTGAVPRPVAVAEFDRPAGFRYTAPVLADDVEGVTVGTRVVLAWGEGRLHPVPAFRPDVSGVAL